MDEKTDISYSLRIGLIPNNSINAWYMFAYPRKKMKNTCYKRHDVPGILLGVSGEN